MPAIGFTDQDMLRSKVITPGWYRCRVEEIGEQLSSKGDSTNYPVELIVLKNADDGSEEFAGVPVSYMFNSKAMGFAIGFLAAFGIAAESGKRYELKNLEGKELEVKIDNEMYKNQMKNRVNHEYRPAQ